MAVANELTSAIYFQASKFQRFQKERTVDRWQTSWIVSTISLEKDLTTAAANKLTSAIYFQASKFQRFQKEKTVDRRQTSWIISTISLEKDLTAELIDSSTGWKTYHRRRTHWMVSTISVVKNLTGCKSDQTGWNELTSASIQQWGDSIDGIDEEEEGRVGWKVGWKRGKVNKVNESHPVATT